MVSTTVVDLDVASEPAWADFVAGHPEGLLYYGLRYRDFLVDVTGATPRYRVAMRGGAIVGVMPTMERDGPLGRVLNALPFFGSYGAPLGVDEEAVAALLADWTRRAEAPGVAAATMIANPIAAHALPAIPFDAEDERTGQFTPLPAAERAEDALLDAIDATARRNIAHARKAGVSVREDPDAFAFLEATHRANMAEIGGLAKPPSYFAATPRRFRHGEDWRLYVASLDGVPVAAVLLFYANGVVEYFTPAITPEGRRSQATALILFEAMVAAARRGFRSWNWGGTWPDQDGVFRFKRKWGAEPRPYRYLVSIRDRRVLTTPRAELLAAYPWFYVVPFRLLDGHDPV